MQVQRGREIRIDQLLKPPPHNGSYPRLAKADFFAAGAEHTALVMKRDRQRQISVDAVGTRPPHHWWQIVNFPTPHLPIF